MSIMRPAIKSLLKAMGGKNRNESPEELKAEIQSLRELCSKLKEQANMLNLIRIDQSSKIKRLSKELDEGRKTKGQMDYSHFENSKRYNPNFKKLLAANWAKSRNYYEQSDMVSQAVIEKTRSSSGEDVCLTEMTDDKSSEKIGVLGHYVVTDLSDDILTVIKSLIDSGARVRLLTPVNFREDQDYRRGSSQLTSSNHPSSIASPKPSHHLPSSSDGKLSLLSLPHPHLLRNKEGNLIHKCHICDKIYKQLKNLRIHLRSHTGERPFKCNFCTKSFVQKAHLTSHHFVHSGEKPCKCDICHKRFTSSSNLRIHLRLHSGHRPYACDLCSAKFTQSGNLTLHKRRHSNERPFVCSTCPRKYISSTGLRTHYKKTNCKP